MISLGLPWWVQWLGVHLLVQGTQARFMGQEYTACCGAAEPCVITAGPTRPEPVLHSKRSPHREKPVRHNQRKPAHSSKDPAQPKIINKQKILKKVKSLYCFGCLWGLFLNHWTKKILLYLLLCLEVYTSES